MCGKIDLDRIRRKFHLIGGLPSLSIFVDIRYFDNGLISAYFITYKHNLLETMEHTGDPGLSL